MSRLDDKKYIPQLTTKEKVLKAAERQKLRIEDGTSAEVEWLTESINKNLAKYNVQQAQLSENKVLSGKLGKLSVAFVVSGLFGVVLGKAVDTITIESLSELAKVVMVGGELAIAAGCASALIKEGVDAFGAKIKGAMDKIADTISTAKYKKEVITFKDELDKIPVASGKYVKAGEEDVHHAVDNDAVYGEKSIEDLARDVQQRQYVEELAAKIQEAGFVDEKGNPWIPKEAQNVETQNVSDGQANQAEETVVQEYVKPESTLVTNVPPHFFDGQQS